MDKHVKEYKELLEKELERSKQHSKILEEIECKLHELKEIAQYAVDNELAKEEVKRMNAQMKALKEEIMDLEKGLIYPVH